MSEESFLRAMEAWASPSLPSLEELNQLHYIAEEHERRTLVALCADVRDRFAGRGSVNELWRLIHYRNSLASLLDAVNASFRLYIAYEAILSLAEALPLERDVFPLETADIFVWLRDKLEFTSVSDRDTYRRRFHRLVRKK